MKAKVFYCRTSQPGVWVVLEREAADLIAGEIDAQKGETEADRLRIDKAGFIIARSPGEALDRAAAIVAGEDLPRRTKKTKKKSGSQKTKKGKK